MKSSYHVHSRWSDGKTPIRDLIAAAGEAGLEEVGISDHYVLAPPPQVVSWSMPLDRLGEYLADVDAAAVDAPPGLTVRRGVEADFFPEQEAVLRGILAEHTFDYIIGSVHYVGAFAVDESRPMWDRLSPAEREEMHHGYWVRIAGLARSGLYDIVGHLDLTKKFGYWPETDLSAEISAALDSIADAGLVVELNTAGWHTMARECYPSPDLLRECRKRGILVQINADAHMPANLTRDFDRAAALLREVGYNQVVRFANRQRVMTPLD
jgi:histidinol-phosphatase (PHP family)